jgi:diacylglycerol O-acyltransferase / wax synthase
VEIGHHHALRVSTLSTAGTLAWGLTVDPTIVPDVDVLAEAIGEETERLVRAVPV